MIEVWKEIEGYPNYQISNLGRVKSLNYLRTGKEKIMKGYKDKYGYLYVGLYKEGKVKMLKIHRLVALAFIDNPDNLQQVNHIDENPTNNSVDNLEWCTAKYNINYGTRNKRASESKSLPILQFSFDGEFIKKWDSATEASRVLGINQGNICSCLKGKLKTAGNYIWCYAIINEFTIDINKLNKVA